MAHIFEHLLLATERTEFDVGAERLALTLAGRCGQPLGVVMPLASNPEFEAEAPALAERAEREAAKKLAELRRQADAGGIAIDLQVRRGTELWQEITDAAHETAAELLVIRRRGRRGFLARMLVGEMVGQVLAHAPCSVLVVPRDAAMWTRRVLVAAEPGETGRRLVALATAVAAECALPLGVVSVLVDDNAARRDVATAFLDDAGRRAAQLGVQATTELLRGAVPAQLLAAAARQAADLLVIGAGRTGAGSVVHEVTGASGCAVLIARPDFTTKEPPR
jgi:nucleotide-binding universal stress UspA family protein